MCGREKKSDQKHDHNSPSYCSYTIADWEEKQWNVWGSVQRGRGIGVNNIGNRAMFV